jgi:hypothetical protein
MWVIATDWKRQGWARVSWPDREAAWTGLRRAAPFLAALTLLLLGYRLHAPGVAQTADYQRYSYGALNYSDIIWLYLRDGLSAHPRPYLDYRLEYPALTGGVIYLLGYAPELRSYFALSYALLACCALATIALLGRLTGARPWYLAAAPGLLLYTGLNWDFAALALLALALLAYQGRRDVWGTVALLLAVWLKFFPIVFLAAIVVERVRAREHRAAATIGGLFIVGSAAINLPLAARHFDTWAYFFVLNASRRPEPSLWTLLPSLPTAQVGVASLALLLVGGLACATLALRSPGPVTLPLGGALLLWWLFSNKIYSPQYSLWVYVALALLGSVVPLWRAFALLDLAYYYASFQILFTATFAGPDAIGQLIAWQARYLLQPLVAVRLLLLLLMVGGAVWRLRGGLRWAGWLAARRGRPGLFPERGHGA